MRGVNRSPNPATIARASSQRGFAPYRCRPHKRAQHLGRGTQRGPARLGRAQPLRADQHVVEHAQVAEHAAVLERARDAERREAFGRGARDVVAVERHAAGIGPVGARDQVEQRRLARAVRPDHAQQFAFGE